MLIVEKVKMTNDPSKRRTVEDIADALCDVLYAVVLLARDYDLDLLTEYEHMLERLEKRLDSGEFGED